MNPNQSGLNRVEKHKLNRAAKRANPAQKKLIAREQQLVAAARQFADMNQIPFTVARDCLFAAADVYDILAQVKRLHGMGGIALYRRFLTDLTAQSSGENQIAVVDSNKLPESIPAQDLGPGPGTTI